ncbi:hypothetical protein [Streptomyces capillispiralis]|uniref:Uncharacterized protein n=1 Tax=Streptomyces capillispiralis TaxID=68182 RepID=A0A561T9D3_9ACTN|nr:hypothetical protein [Streptomyces capillispiralis]TWF83703.1 hypothetical protein FHX78_11631 [Streptomyces capillispiralis]GHH91503.1 hypothetical protein GCM10017779_19600 [Streptomyces capillispiralis]
MAFTPEEFLGRLRSDDFATLVGLIKQPDTGDDHFLFSPGRYCFGHWVKIPLALIQDIEWLANVVCPPVIVSKKTPARTIHPLVRLTFKAFESAEGRTLASLLTAQVAATQSPEPAPASRAGRSSRRRCDCSSRGGTSRTMPKAAARGEWSSCMDRCLYQYWPDWDTIDQCQRWVCGDEPLPPDIEL